MRTKGSAGCNWNGNQTTYQKCAWIQRGVWDQDPKMSKPRLKDLDRENPSYFHFLTATISYGLSDPVDTQGHTNTDSYLESFAQPWQNLHLQSLLILFTCNFCVCINHKFSLEGWLLDWIGVRTKMDSKALCSCSNHRLKLWSYKWVIELRKLQSLWPEANKIENEAKKLVPCIY